jgi:Cd(II)/Pb(II)-responsive transcriptional regulator
MTRPMKIGDLAKQAGCPVVTIRYYEQARLLLPPERSASNYRQYSVTHLERLLFIRRCRTLDMTHEEIRTLLRFRDSPDEDCDAVNVLLDDHIARVRQQIADLEKLRRHLTTLRRQCRSHQAVRECGILKGLAG